MQPLKEISIFKNNRGKWKMHIVRHQETSMSEFIEGISEADLIKGVIRNLEFELEDIKEFEAKNDSKD